MANIQTACLESVIDVKMVQRALKTYRNLRRYALQREELAISEQLQLLFSEKRCDRILSDCKMFFVVGLGRSGTTFLAELLANVPGCAVYHEAPSDRDAMIDAYADARAADKYVQSVARRRLVAARIKETNCSVYGEVNSYLRYHIDSLMFSWEPVILHLVRDGKDVVRSMMNRRTFTAQDRHHTGQIKPQLGEWGYKEWSQWTRFERCCWYWSYTNERLLLHELPLCRLEDITTNYHLFQQRVLNPLDLAIPKADWEERVVKKANISQKQEFPSWSEWSSKQKAQFEDLCGGTMATLGYSIE